MAKIVKVVPPLPETERGKPCVISCDGKGDRLLYCHGTNVIWRSVEALSADGVAETPDTITSWKNHTRKVTCASMDPKGNWVVSGDITGEVRLWGAKGDLVEKNKYKLWNGPIRDIGWGDDSKRIVACGEGAEVSACALLWDTGNRTGEVAGHSKAISSISFKSQRPFRVASGSEDFCVNIHEGPPFKLAKSNSDAHDNFVNCVRFSPDGEWLASCGSDGKVVLFQGKDGVKVKEFEKPAKLSGSLFWLAWSPDSKFLATAGGDKTLRIWSVASGAQVCEQVLGTDIGDQVLGVAWGSPSKIQSVCFDGRLCTWTVDAAGTATLAGSVTGTQGPLGCVAVEPVSGTLFRGSPTGVSTNSPGSTPLKIGKTVKFLFGHSPGIQGDATAWSIALDDTMRRVGTDGKVASEVKIGEATVGAGWLDAEESTLLCVSSKSNFVAVTASGIAWSAPGAIPREPTAVGTLPGKKLAVGVKAPNTVVAGVQSREFTIYLFDIASNTADGLTKVAELNEHVHELSVLKFNPAGDLLASADISKSIVIWDLSVGSTPTIKISGWSMTARITSLCWMKSFLIAASVDSNIAFFDTADKQAKGKIDRAHKGGSNDLARISDQQFASVGADGYLNVYELS